jgi:PAS domain S-box-containing protein
MAPAAGARPKRGRAGATAEAQAATPAVRPLDAIKAFISSAPLAAAVTDLDLKFLKVSPAWLADFGLEEADVLGKSSYDLAPETHAKYRPLHERCFAGENVSSEPERIALPNGSVRWMTWDAAPWRDEQGRIAGLLIISRDVTAQMEAQEEVRRSRAFLDTVLEHTPLAMMVKDEKGRFLMMNRATEDMFGIDREVLIGRSLAEAAGGEVSRRAEEEDRLTFASDEPVTFEESLVDTRSRGQRLLRKTKVVIRNDGAPDYLLVVSEDVTERRREQAELEQTRAFLATVIDNIPVGLTVKDISSSHMMVMNPAARSIYCIGDVQIPGPITRGIFPPEQAERFFQQDREVIESGEMRTYEEDPVRTLNGTRYLNRRKSLIRNADGPDYLLSIFEDVTDRKLAQDALKEALARAEAANVAKSEFLANMSHEIRTPLNGVLGLADALGRMELTPRQQEIVGMIVSSGKALTGILSDVLDLAKAEAGQLELREEAFSLRDTIGSAAFLFETVARDKGLDFKVSFDTGGGDALVGDPLRIKQIVSNLISNAVKFTGEGEVAIHTAVAMAPDGVADLLVTVKDTGRGFTEEVRERLFARFEQGDGSITRQYGGAGLGLSIALTLARMMEGSIDCAGAPGKGASFSFRARLRPAASAAGANPVTEDEDLPPRRVRVLLAEDHVINQMVVQLMLDGTAEVVIAGNGREAVDAALAGPAFDVILMDTQMPVMDGLTAIRLIRQAEAQSGLPRTPVISLTANAMAHQVQAAMEAGADLHLAKPITSDALYAAIEEAMALEAQDQAKPARTA